MMINQFLFKNNTILSTENLNELRHHIKKNSGLFNHYKKYTLVFGYPLGMGHEKTQVKSEHLFSMYQLYGIAFVDETHLGVGRKVSKNVDLEAWQLRHAIYRRLPSKFAVSNDVSSATLEIKNNLKSENIQKIKGILIDHQNKLFIIVGVLPDEIENSNLEKIKEGEDNGCPKSKD